jgi:hypothetical protein
MIQQMLQSEGWQEVEKIIERHKQDYLSADRESAEERRIAYQTLENLKNELIDKITA